MTHGEWYKRDVCGNVRRGISGPARRGVRVSETESFWLPAGETVRILDAGCGAGRLIACLAEMLPRLRPGLTYQYYGFDVTDRPTKQFGEVVQEVARHMPESERVLSQSLSLEACHPGVARPRPGGAALLPRDLHQPHERSGKRRVVWHCLPGGRPDLPGGVCVVGP